MSVANSVPSRSLIRLLRAVAGKRANLLTEYLLPIKKLAVKYLVKPLTQYELIEYTQLDSTSPPFFSPDRRLAPP